jgi:methylmalonyl-CoA mutase
MLEPSIHDILRESFLKTNQEQWFRAASQELAGKDVLENLSWKVDEFVFSPYYDESDLKRISSLERFRHASQSSHDLHAGSWENLPRIIIRDVKEANRQALHYLASGADGILFDLSETSDFTISRLLQDIDWRYCSISFTATRETKIVKEILSYVSKRNMDPSALKGSLFWENAASANDISEPVPAGLSHFHSLGIISTSISAVKDISNCLQQAVLIMDKVSDMGLDKKRTFTSISLSITPDENFFLTIGKLRALRALWYQLSQAYQISDYKPGDLYIHVVSKDWTSEKFQPHGNMIKNAVDAIAAVLGGCDGLTLPAENESNEMMKRVAINVSNICKEESHLDKVADKISGSYMLESISNDLAKAAWKHFQHYCA